MKISIEKEEIISKLKRFFKQSSSHYCVDMAFLYGSWTGGYPHRDSDIDLALVFSREIATEKTFSLITDISYELGKKLNREVNVISVYRDFRQPMLYYNAVILGTPLYIKDKARFLSLKIEAISQMEDFRIFGIPWQLEIAGKFILRPLG